MLKRIKQALFGARRSSPEMSRLASKILTMRALPPTANPTPGMYNSLLFDAWGLAGSVLSQDEVRG